MSIKCKTWSLGVREPLSRMIGVLPKNKSMTYCKDECVSFSKVFFLKGKRMNIEEFDEASSDLDEEVNHNFRPRKTRKRNYDDMDDFIVDDEDDDEFFDESDDEEDYDKQDGDDEQYGDKQDGDKQDEIVSDVNTGKNVEDDKVEKLWKLYQSGRITKDMYENYEESAGQNGRRTVIYLDSTLRFRPNMNGFSFAFHF